MTSGKIISETPLSLSDVKEELKKIKKRDGEFDFRAQRTNEYVESCVKVSKKAAKEIYDKIAALNILRLKDIHIHKIIDIMPFSVDELKIIFQSYSISLGNDNLKKILEILDDYR